MIKPKKGKCIDCPASSKEQFLYSQGRCQSCYWIWRKSLKKPENEVKITDLTPKNSLILTPKPVIFRQLQVLVNQRDNQTSKQTLQNWFTFHIENGAYACENCWLKLSYATSQMAYSCQAHILPKSSFPSVKAHLDNHMYLGGMFQNCSCHGQFDSSWSKAEKMKIFPTAIERFKLFKNEIAESEYHKLRKTPFYQYL